MIQEIFNKSEQELVQVLKRIWRINELAFIGVYFHSNAANEKEFGYISNVYANDRQVFYPESINKRSVSIRVPRNEALIEGQLYKVHGRIADLELRRQLSNPYLLLHDEKYPVVKETSYILPKDFIKEWFSKTGATPKDAATIASQLKLNSLELYTQTERFIFELIQNADDMPANSRGVKVELHLLNNYLLFRHNGKFFDRDDVKAIADAAKSNKSENVRQTGYKGIGFKSVFTDSNSVFIRSGSYSFKFDKNDPIYYNFKNLYNWQLRLLANSPRDLEQFELDYKENKIKYENIDNIPWQIKPIWVNRNEFPEELLKSEFLKHAEVNIALEIGENVINAKNYAFMIESILSKPKFILFLRNTKGFDYYRLDANQLQKQQSIELKEKNNLIDISHNDIHVATFSKIHFDIEINNDEFRNAGFNIEKFEEKEGVFKFKDEYGEIKSIPEKLGLLNSTRMTFASQIKDGEVIKLDKSHSILYNYLPTSDQRFGFPFLVNADFITNTSREFILKENKWNQYLMYHIGKNCVDSLVSLCHVQESVDGKEIRKYVKSYLSLLPDTLLNEDDEELSEINKAFNRGFLSSVNEVAFIVNSLGAVKSTSEIIVDETKFSKVLNSDIFQIISETQKDLPASEISNQVLNKAYLNIESYTADKLKIHLEDGEKQNALVKVLSALDSESYKKFLEWLVNFCDLNDVDNDWILDLPIIRLETSVITLRESLAISDFYIRSNRTSELEAILTKVGFTLSEFSIDNDNLKHLKAIVLQQNCYLKSDVQLYEHIAAAKDLSNLTATEKNTLIIFFESLDEVGKAKYAKALALFKAKKVGGSLKPLNSLISNSCIDLPSWLFDFLIDSDEEKALSTTFQGQLLKEKDLLEKLFCNAAAFNEVIKNINSGNIEEFYTYLLKLLNNKPEETKIDFSLIPWVFIEASSKFILASTVYWPESITKLASAKYASVKSVFEIISVEQLPHFSALQIKGPFALGSKELKLNEITPNQNSFDEVAVNDFLDWAEANGEKDLLNQLSFTKVDDKFSMGKVSGTLCYYTTDDSLITFIDASAINTKLNLFPKELYTKERNKIGLLEGVSLLKYLLENGLSTPALAKFIQVANDAQLSLQYLEMLTELNIESSKSYTIEDAEFKILKLVVQHLVDDDAKLAPFKKKIFLDNHSLAEKAFSDDVRFYKPGAAILEIKTKLKEILPAYQNQTYSISDVISKFIDFRDDPKIIKIFKSESRPPSRIYRELNELKPPYFSPTQTFFLSYYKTLNPNEDVFRDKVLFTNANPDSQAQHVNEIHEFLDICLKENSYTGFVAQGIFSAFNPAKLVSIEEYAITSEKLPTWLSEWLNKSDTENKKDYLKLLGINNADSPVVLYRKAIKEAQPEPMNVNRELINNDQLLYNNLIYLSNQQKQANFILKKEVLQPLYQKLQNRKVVANILLFPSLQSFQLDSYSLDRINDSEELHLIHDGWGDYKKAIFSNLVKTNKITDEVLPKAYRDDLKVIQQTVIKSPDIENLKANAYPFDEEFYQEWNLKNQYNVQIYKGKQLPYLIKYNNIIINNVKDKVADCIEKVYYVVESKKESILIYLEGILPESALNDLKLNKQNLIEKEKEAEKKIKFTEEESAAWKKLFGNEIPEAYYQDINLAACVSALVYLNNNGYDVSKADSNLFNSHGFAQVEPVYKGELNEPLTIMCRSAIGGILYLTAQAWDRLENKEVHLFVKTGRKDNNHHLFMDKNDVLKISDTKYQVFRVEADSSSATTDEILRGEFAKDKIWLILKIKETDSYKSIFEGGIKRNEENPDYENINTSENSYY